MKKGKEWCKIWLGVRSGEEIFTDEHGEKQSISMIAEVKGILDAYKVAAAFEKIYNQKHYFVVVN